MIRHYLRIAWRQIRRHPIYASIHVLGLSIGICACTVIYLIARYDLGFDKFHPDADRIYRVVGDIRFPEGATMFLNCPPQLAELEHGIPGFQQEVGFHTFGSTVTIPAGNGKPEADFSTKPDRRYGTSLILTGPSFFDLFPHQWVAAGPAVLDEPNLIVLTESAARKYFGSVPVNRLIGRALIVDDSLPLTVAGIVRDWDGLSDLDYTGFISISTAPNSWLKSRFPTTDWRSLIPHTSQAFVKLAKGVRPEQVNAELAAFVARRHPVLFPGTSDMHLYLQSLRDMHYTPNFHRQDTGDDFPQAYLPLLYALMGVAMFILLLAVINFVNLTTAQSLQRVKEVGIRKVMGSSRGGLIRQFFVETFLLAVGAVVLSALLVKPALHLFSDYIPNGVEFHVLDGRNLLFLLSITLITTLIAGVYPAKLISGYLPVTSLKGSTDKGGVGGSFLRKSLIVFQFTISLLFIIGSLVIGRQIRFMRDADKGFDTDAVMTISRFRPKQGQMQLFAQRVRGISGVRDVVLESNAPMGSAHAG
ncbi:MAG TPA: ABC transporter permease, partial [Puia sp.]|nr:ABC transporter permease [Puia sp.]